MSAEANLTRTQREALDDLRRAGAQWPTSRGRYGARRSSTARWSRRTLQALVDAGLAEWVDADKWLLPHVVPTRGGRGE